MHTFNGARLRRAAIRQMKTTHDAELAKASSALASLDAPEDVRRALRCLAGRDHPLPTPSGADLSFREDLARHLARRIGNRISDGRDHHYVGFDVESEPWVCSASRAVIPFRNMNAMAVRRLKRSLPNLVFAPATRLRQQAGGPVELVPSLRVFALVGEGNFETIERSVDMVRRELDPRGAERRTRTRVRPMIAGTVIQELARMLVLNSGREASVASERTPSERACTCALIRLAAAATMPIKAIVGGSGTMKIDLKFATGQAKAAAVGRHGEGPSPIAQTEIYSAVGDMMPTLNDERMRLPFCLA